MDRSIDEWKIIRINVFIKFYVEVISEKMARMFQNRKRKKFTLMQGLRKKRMNGWINGQMD